MCVQGDSAIWFLCVSSSKCPDRLRAYRGVPFGVISSISNAVWQDHDLSFPKSVLRSEVRNIFT